MNWGHKQAYSGRPSITSLHQGPVPVTTLNKTSWFRLWLSHPVLPLPPDPCLVIGPCPGFSINGTSLVQRLLTTVRKQCLHTFTQSYSLHRFLVVCNYLIYLFIFACFQNLLFFVWNVSSIEVENSFLFILLYFRQCLLHCRQSIHTCGTHSNEIPQHHPWLLANNGAMTQKI